MGLHDLAVPRCTVDELDSYIPIPNPQGRKSGSFCVRLGLPDLANKSVPCNVGGVLTLKIKHRLSDIQI